MTGSERAQLVFCSICFNCLVDYMIAISEMPPTRQNLIEHFDRGPFPIFFDILAKKNWCN